MKPYAFPHRRWWAIAAPARIAVSLVSLLVGLSAIAQVQAKNPANPASPSNQAPSGSGAAPPAAANGPRDLLASAKATEEGDAHLDRALEDYRAIVAEFDRNRAVAAEALFRIGEVARKLHKDAEANAAYERILREFPDQTDFAAPSQKQLGVESPQGAAGSMRYRTSPELMERYGLPPYNQPAGAVEQGTGEEAASPFKMSPELMKRYGLLPQATEAGHPGASRISTGMSPELRARYGLAPAGGMDTGGRPMSNRYGETAAASGGMPNAGLRMDPTVERQLARIAAHQQELDALRADARELASQQRRILREQRAIAVGNLLTIPTQFIDDSHLLELLSGLQRAREAVELATPAQGEALQHQYAVQQEITSTYFDTIYKERLKNALNVVQSELDRLHNDIDHQQAELEEIRTKASRGQ